METTRYQGGITKVIENSCDAQARRRLIWMRRVVLQSGERVPFFELISLFFVDILVYMFGGVGLA